MEEFQLKFPVSGSSFSWNYAEIQHCWPKPTSISAQITLASGRKHSPACGLQAPQVFLCIKIKTDGYVSSLTTNLLHLQCLQHRRTKVRMLWLVGWQWWQGFGPGLKHPHGGEHLLSWVLCDQWQDGGWGSPEVMASTFFHTFFRH